MGMQILCSLHSEVPEEKDLRGASKGIGWNLQGTGTATRKQDRGRPSDGGSCAHAGVDSAKVLGFTGSRVHQRKSAIHIARTWMGRRQNFVGQNFWARGYFVSTVGRDEATIREYIRKQEELDEKFDQMEMFK